MTYFLKDILRQPDELQRALDYLCGTGYKALEKAAAAARGRHVYLSGIGSSWHASLSAAPLFYSGAQPVYLQDTAELLHYATFPPDAVVILISRSGRSIEVVQLLAKARESGAIVIGLTNLADGRLAQDAQIPIVVPTMLDYAISVNTYSTLAMAAGILASVTVGNFDSALADKLSRVIIKTAHAIPRWQEQIASSDWLFPGGNYYFLARGSSLGSCHETRLLWEEGIKSPATAMGTAGFRHGPQEMVSESSHIAMWIDAKTMREQDLAVARDLRRLGASVMVIGQDLPADVGDLVFQLPKVPAEWQFLIDIIPAQLTAEHLARLSGVDSDTFRTCAYIVEDDYGLLRDEAAAPKEEIK
jgi:fructoselysine-6-P-deglycase FrlB-like protein